MALSKIRTIYGRKEQRFAIFGAFKSGELLEKWFIRRFNVENGFFWGERVFERGGLHIRYRIFVVVNLFFHPLLKML